MFEFTETITIQAPHTAVWELMRHTERWWPASNPEHESLRQLDDGPLGVGTRHFGWILGKRGLWSTVSLDRRPCSVRPAMVMINANRLPDEPGGTAMEVVRDSSRISGRVAIVSTMLAAAAGLVLAACGSGQPAATNSTGSPPASTAVSAPGGTLPSTDVTGLLTIRAEEKAGQDAYHVFANRYGQSVFTNLANSQATQTRTVTAMMSRFGVRDPMSTAPAGSFTDPTVQRMYDTMIAAGSASADHALDAIEAFEHQHAADLRRIQAQTSQPDLRRMYTNLMQASASHLDACTHALDDMGGHHGP